MRDHRDRIRPESDGSPRRARQDLSSLWLLAIAVALPPIYAFAAPLPLAAYKLRRIPGLILYRRAFSGATLSLGYGLASEAFHAIPASVAGMMPGTGRHALTWTASVVACGLLGNVINHALLIVAIRLSDPSARVREMAARREPLTTDFLEFSLAASLTLVVRVNPVLMALALPAVLLCRRSIMHAQLFFQSRIDTKTGLLNSATWQREAAAEFSRALRTGTPLALALVGIDEPSPSLRAG